MLNNYDTKHINKYFYIYLLGLIFLMFWVFSAFNYLNPDFSNYKSGYELSYFNNLVYSNNIGYSFLTALFNEMGFTFTAFLSIYNFSLLILLYIALKNLGGLRIYPLLLFLVFPFLFDLIQLSNFGAYVIVYYGLKFLNRDKYKTGLFYILTILVASTFHTIALIYLLLLLSRLTYKKMIKFVVILTFLFSIIIFSFFRFILFNSLIRGFLIQINPRILFYLSTEMKVTTTMQYVAYIIIFILLSIIAYKIRSSDEKNFIDILLFKITFSSLAFIPFAILDPTLFRVFRNMLLIFFIYISADIKTSSKKFRLANNIIRLLLIPISISSFLNFLYFDKRFFESVTIPIFKNNYVFEILFNNYFFLLIIILLVILSFILIINLNKEEKL